MKNKIIILIIASVLALLALSGIQAYLIQNAYQLKKDNFLKETKEAISEIDDGHILDSLYGEVWGENMMTHLSDYKNNRFSKEEAAKKIIEEANAINPEYTTHYENELDKINLGYDIKYKKIISSLLIFEGSKIDTIILSTSQNKIKLFGRNFNETNEEVINTNRWFTQNQFIDQRGGTIKTKTYDLEVISQDVILIRDWKNIVYGRMMGLLLSSLLIFLFVISLLYYSIKNLVNQKKITAIKTDFINNITHELKTPLATLGIASKSLQKEAIKASPEAFENTLKIIDRQNDRLQKLIDQVLTNSLSSEDIVLYKEQIADTLYFDNLIEDFKLSKQQDQLSIINHVCETEVILRIDIFHFTTALLNILDNAVKYSTDHTIISIKTHIERNQYIIAIADNGIGISEKNQQYIFDKFYRVSDGNVHNVKGLGLGMYYTHQIIKAHKGSITIESEPNKGTAFTIKIPIH
ncbi:HAMP domain-containing histidine kinase [Aquimarina sp. TRL1]|nr:HAMP domain-containing histidine kinase [Aquimarina sp. TRL1]